MDKLQELLDERYPLTDGMNLTLRTMHTISREAFTEGYNAAMEEMGCVRKPIEKILEECKSLLGQGKKAGAILHYKEQAGGSVQEAAYALGIYKK